MRAAEQQNPLEETEADDKAIYRPCKNMTSKRKKKKMVITSEEMIL